MEKEWTVRIVHGDQVDEVRLPDGASPFSAIRTRIPSFGHACNGNGTCGKCRLLVAGPDTISVSTPQEAEMRLLGETQVAAGHRLACLLRIHGDVSLEVETRARKAKIAAESGFAMPTVQPVIRRMTVRVPAPSLQDQRSDMARLLDAARAQLPDATRAQLPDATRAQLPDAARAQLPDAARAQLSMDALPMNRRLRALSVPLAATLPRLLRDQEGVVTLVLREQEDTGVFEVGGLLSGDVAGTSFGIAVDIGTTTLAGCLMDLHTGKVLATETRLNDQKRYGADVIARIQHAMTEAEGVAQLRDSILADLWALGQALWTAADVNPDMVDEWVLTGNTTMGHLLMGWPSAAIAAAPFIPVHVGRVTQSANAMWPDAPAHACVELLPGVSAYVGADTVSAVLACGLPDTDDPSLVVDLGTNGELVLGSRNGLLACSTAAGPAFEGAGIRFGMGAVDGAIDSVTRNGTLEAPELTLTVLGGGPAAGLCGTGLLDAIAVLLELGIVDETGRLLDVEECPESLPEVFRKRLTELDGQSAFLLVPAAETEHGRDLVLTQRDIREFQNAKAAVSAGITTLADVAGIPLSGIATAYLAGGLGTWLNPDSAVRTGLIPIELQGRIRPVGNAALAGAMQCLLNADVRGKADATASSMRFVELSGRRDFNDRYVEAMFFGEE